MLHFYDETGLLKPARVGANGYRFYEEPQLLSLQQILFYRELGFELKQIKAIASVEGVDGVFIGPNDLSASFGHIGNWGHAEVQAALEDAVKRLKTIGKPAGILTPNEEEAKKFISDETAKWRDIISKAGIPQIQ